MKLIQARATGALGKYLGWVDAGVINLNITGDVMNRCEKNIKVGNHKMLRNIVVAAIPLLLAGLPQTALATTADNDFRTFVMALCAGTINQPPGTVWDTNSLNAMCPKATGAGNVGGLAVSVGSSSARGGSVAREKNVFREQLDEEREKSKGKGASADGGGWGLLVAPQFGKNHRIDTQLEHGFDSELTGLSIGLDYRFSDRFVTGLVVGYAHDNVTFRDNASSLKTTNSNLTLYGTWLPADAVAVDGYLGYGKNKMDSQRHVLFNLINGTAIGNSAGRQLMGGLSISYQADWGWGGLSPFINLDTVKSTADGYSETGTTGLELHFKENTIRSTTSSLGLQANTMHSFQWGSLSPALRIAAVHEYQNNAQERPVELVSAPGVGITVRTDAPDRDYLTAGAGLTAGLNSGAQLFLNYEARTKDKLLKGWAASAGVLVEF